MKVTIQPKYQPLETFIYSLPAQFDTTGTLIYEGRNTLRTYTVNGIDLVVKRFKKPHIINRFIYGYFRPSKANRSYHYGIKLLERGIKTPEPVAFIEEYNCGFTSSYYVSLKSAYENEIRLFHYNPAIDERRYILEAFGLFTAAMHQAGVIHKDYSPGNILFGTENNKVDFELVDINRIQFKPVTEEEGYRALKRLYFTDEVYTEIAKGYARGRGFDETTAVERILYYKNRFMNRR